MAQRVLLRQKARERDSEGSWEYTGGWRANDGSSYDWGENTTGSSWFAYVPATRGYSYPGSSYRDGSRGSSGRYGGGNGAASSGSGSWQHYSSHDDYYYDGESEHYERGQAGSSYEDPNHAYAYSGGHRGGGRDREDASSVGRWTRWEETSAASRDRREKEASGDGEAEAWTL